MTTRLVKRVVLLAPPADGKTTPRRMEVPVYFERNGLALHPAWGFDGPAMVGAPFALSALPVGYREVCLTRSAGNCECGCGYALTEGGGLQNGTPELDHFFGRGKVKQSVETCWILRADCHREKTNNRPDAATWLRKFIEHLHGIPLEKGRGGVYGAALAMARKRLAFVEARSFLPAAPRLNR